MSNAAKTGLALVIIIAVIVVGLIWYMGSPSAPSVRAPILTSNSAPVTAVGDASDASISGDLSSVDSSMSILAADAKDVDSTAATPATSTAQLSTDQLINKTQSLRSLSDSERSVLVSDIRADAQMRLVGPEVSILAAVDHIRDTVDLFQPVYMKLQTRIQARAASSASSTSAMSASLSDMDAKLTDASSQATAAQTEALALKPDQGNRTLLQTNKASLADARSKAKAAIQDLAAARKDADTIMKLLRPS